MPKAGQKYVDLKIEKQKPAEQQQHDDGPDLVTQWLQYLLGTDRAARVDDEAAGRRAAEEARQHAGGHLRGDPAVRSIVLHEQHAAGPVA